MSKWRRIALYFEHLGAAITGAVWGHAICAMVFNQPYNGFIWGRIDAILLPALCWGVPFVIARIGLDETAVLAQNETARRSEGFCFLGGFVVGMVYAFGMMLF